MTSSAVNPYQLSAHEGRDDAADPGEHGGGPDPDVPDHGGEHLGGVHVDHGEGACASVRFACQRDQILSIDAQI